MRWIFPHSPVHGWSWEHLDREGRVHAESHSRFETREEAEDDAALHGYIPGSDERDIARIVLIQRDEDAQGEIRRALAHMHVTVARSGHHARELAESEPADCYIVDCGVKSGALARFCAALRAIDPNVPIILYSDEPDIDHGGDALVAGANLMLRKPRDLMRLPYTVDAMLHMSRTLARARGDLPRA